MKLYTHTHDYNIVIGFQKNLEEISKKKIIIIKQKNKNISKYRLKYCYELEKEWLTEEKTLQPGSCKLTFSVDCDVPKKIGMNASQIMQVVYMVKPMGLASLKVSGTPLVLMA